MGGGIMTGMALNRTHLACIETYRKIRAMQRDSKIVHPGANLSEMEAA